MIFRGRVWAPAPTHPGGLHQFAVSALLGRPLWPPAGGDEPRPYGLPFAPGCVYPYFPVEPKPPVPRPVSSRLSTRSSSACTTGMTASWAMRSPGRTV